MLGEEDAGSEFGPGVVDGVGVGVAAVELAKGKSQIVWWSNRRDSMTEEGGKLKAIRCTELHNSHALDLPHHRCQSKRRE